MNAKILLLVLMVCMATVPSLTASDNYAGGDIVLGGAGVKQVTQVTQAPTVAATAAPSLQPVAASGSLSVASSPSGATIYVDGVQRGITPATIPGLFAAGHTVLLKMDGYQDYSASVTISAGQTQTVSATLVQAAGAGPAAGGAAPVKTKSPGFEAAFGLAAIGAVLCLHKGTR